MIGAGDIARSRQGRRKLGGSITGAFDVNAEGSRSFAKEFDCAQLTYEQIPEYVGGADYAVISTPPTSGSTTARWCSQARAALPRKAHRHDHGGRAKDRRHGKKYDAEDNRRLCPSLPPGLCEAASWCRAACLASRWTCSATASVPASATAGTTSTTAPPGTDPKLACGMTIESVSHEFNLLTSLAREFQTIACNVKGAHRRHTPVRHELHHGHALQKRRRSLHHDELELRRGREPQRATSAPRAAFS